MTFWTLVRRSLLFRARSHAGVILGAAVGTAALTGALLVGDSVRGTLVNRALARLGPIEYALSTSDRFFQGDLKARMCENLLSRQLAVPKLKPGTLIPQSIWPSAMALMLPGIVAKQDGSSRANAVNILGVENPPWPTFAGWGKLGPGVSSIDPDGDRVHMDEVLLMQLDRGDGPLMKWKRGETALINEQLAHQLGARPGDEVIVRIRKPSALSSDAVITPKDQDTVALRLRVGAILRPDMLGDFSLLAHQSPPANVFLPYEVLCRATGLSNQANLLLNGPVVAAKKQEWLERQRAGLADWIREKKWTLSPVPNSGGRRFYEDRSRWLVRAVNRLEPAQLQEFESSTATAILTESVKEHWVPEDLGLTVHNVEQPAAQTGDEYIRPSVEISTSRIFLEEPLTAAAVTPRTKLVTNHWRLQNDSPADVAFAQTLTNNVRILTYVANLISKGEHATPYSMIAAADRIYVPEGMLDDEIVVNAWLADDLDLKTGDRVAVSYYVTDSGSRLTERTNSFRVREVVPMKGLYADRTLMPEFPGLAKAESTQDWDAGFPLIYTIRQKDEAYWKAHRGTPKAFVTLAAGQKMWANRFGSLTAIRYLVPTNSFPSTVRDCAYRNLIANIAPATLGLRYEPVRELALRAASQSQDFGQLFLGFSIFLVVAALLLMSLLFQFSIEQRVEETGTLLALGFSPRVVRRLFLTEGVALAITGAALGVVAGTFYAKAMLWGLTTIWRSAIGMSALEFHGSAASFVIGFAAATAIAAVSIWLVLRKQARKPARELLSGPAESQSLLVRGPARSLRALLLCAVAALLGISLVGWAIATRQTSNAGAFFGAGALLLVAGVAAATVWLATIRRQSTSGFHSLGELALRSAARRRSRSLAVIALLASGTFVVVSLAVFRLDANRDAANRASGTGGFTFIAESTIPVIQDLSTPAGRDALGLPPKDFSAVNIVPFRVRRGDDASCLNLNRAQRPRLLGVKPESLKGRFTATGAGWDLLKANLNRPEEVPAIGDAASIQWALGLKVGDTLDYLDERGRPFKLRLVAAVANSVLQGSLIIDEAQFLQKFPSESGYRMFLVDAPADTASQVSATLSRALSDAGLEVTRCADKLNAFNAVQNTYLGTFQVLGGLGLLLGSAGLGIIVLRNVMERRAELAVLLAVGFRRRSLEGAVLGEHALLLCVGLGLGILAAAIAVLPALFGSGTGLPVRSLAITLAAVLANGFVWTWMATRVATKGNLVAALRNE